MKERMILLCFILQLLMLLLMMLTTVESRRTDTDSGDFVEISREEGQQRERGGRLGRESRGDGAAVVEARPGRKVRQRGGGGKRGTRRHRGQRAGQGGEGSVILLMERVEGLSSNLSHVWALLTSLEARVSHHHPPPTTTTTTTTAQGTTEKAEADPSSSFDWCLNANQSTCLQHEGARVCSGRGRCECGTCICYANEEGSSTYGAFCECSDELCPRYNGVVCGGRGRGLCMCNRCNCNPGFTGATCECSSDLRPCYNPLTGLLCSGNGVCQCGSCKCSETEAGIYSGEYCEESPTSPSSWCERLRYCIICHHSNPALRDLPQYSYVCPHTLCPPYLSFVDNTDDGMRMCRFMEYLGSVGDCALQFFYRPHNRYLEVSVDASVERSCVTN